MDSKLPPFEAHVFFNVDGALAYSRDRFDTLAEAQSWADMMFDAYDHPQSAIVYERSVTRNERGVYEFTPRYERRVDNESEAS